MSKKIVWSILGVFFLVLIASIYIEVSKTALSAWKVKKNRIPLKILKNICLSIEMSYLDVLKNVFETDREIAEII